MVALARISLPKIEFETHQFFTYIRLYSRSEQKPCFFNLNSYFTDDDMNDPEESHKENSAEFSKPIESQLSAFQWLHFHVYHYKDIDYVLSLPSGESLLETTGYVINYITKLFKFEYVSWNFSSFNHLYEKIHNYFPKIDEFSIQAYQPDLVTIDDIEFILNEFRVIDKLLISAKVETGLQLTDPFEQKTVIVYKPYWVNTIAVINSTSECFHFHCCSPTSCISLNIILLHWKSNEKLRNLKRYQINMSEGDELSDEDIQSIFKGFHDDSFDKELAQNSSVQ